MEDLSSDRKKSLQDNYFGLKKNIEVLAKQVGKKEQDIQLIVVSKKRLASEIAFVHSLGQNIFAENYIAEAVEKQELLKNEKILWHFTGPIQSNKIKFLPYFDLIHSLDDKAHALKLNEKCKNVPMKVLIQVNIGEEVQKSGISVKLLDEFAEYVLSLKKLHLLGLMCITPICQASAESRKYFAHLRELKENLERKLKIILPELSMGMSSDYKEAILEGATMVRVGTDVFK